MSEGGYKKLNRKQFNHYSRLNRVFNYSRSQTTVSWQTNIILWDLILNMRTESQSTQKSVLFSTNNVPLRLTFPKFCLGFQISINPFKKKKKPTKQNQPFLSSSELKKSLTSFFTKYNAFTLHSSITPSISRAPTKIHDLT